MEALLTIFYLSGQVKSLLEFYSIALPIDLTIISVLLLFAGLIWQYRGNKFPVKFNYSYITSTFILLVFYIWIFITIFYSPSENYSKTKVIYFGLNIIAFVFPFVCKELDIKKFIRYISVFSLLLSIIFIYLFINNYFKGYRYENYDFISGLYLTCSTLLGVNVIILASTNFKIFRSYIVQIFITVFSFAIMILMGARGPIVFTVFLLLVFFIIKFFRNTLLGKKIKILHVIGASVFSILLLAVVYYVFSDEIDFMIKRSLMRMNLIVSTSEGADMGHSVNVRLNQLDLSLALIFDNLYNFLFGYGIGSFGILEKGFDHRSYPHNILLEIWVETGFVGVIIFSIFILFILRYKINTNKKCINIIVIFYILLNSMKSSSIIDIRTYFMIFSLYLLKSNVISYSDSEHTNQQQA